jgi:chromosomal replication initiator protein
MSEQNYKAIWQEALTQIEAEYKENGQETEFNLWYNMEYVEDENETITVSVPSDFMWSQMTERGNVKRVEEKILEISGQSIKIKYILKKTTSELKKSLDAALSHKPAETISKKDDSSKKEETIKKHELLNEDYTFDTFVSGDNNAFAYNVSLAISKNPGITYNPLLLYGGVGLGKTHLMQAIGNYIWKEKKGDVKICYISTENFMNEYTFAIRDTNPKNKTIEKFKSKYRNLDVLLLDDIQFLEKKEGLQQELFYTFESLFNNKKQMVFTCDRPITDIKGIEDRLRNRFTRGLSVDMKAPNYETRKAILQKKMSILNKHIPEDIIDYIAKNVQTNVRDLESCLTKMIGYSDLINKELTIDIAKDLLRDTFSQATTGAITIETIQKVVADHYNISLSDIKSKKRSKQFIVPRQIAIYLARELTEYSFPDLGNEFGGRDHTTAMHSYEKIEELIKTDSSLNSTIESLIREIKDYKK